MKGLLSNPLLQLVTKVFFIVISKCVCYDFRTSNLDKVRSNNFIVLCVSNASEFQDISVRKFQFGETEYGDESDVYDCFMLFAQKLNEEGEFYEYNRIVELVV